MGKYARHHTAFNRNVLTHGMISDDMTVDCDEYIPHFTLRTDFPGIPHHECTGDNFSIIVSVVGHRRFGDLCTDVVNRFLLPDGDHRQQRVIVLKDDYGMRTSWVVCEYLKDLLNSIMFGESRRFNVETFLFYKECEQQYNMSLVTRCSAGHNGGARDRRIGANVVILRFSMDGSNFILNWNLGILCIFLGSTTSSRWAS